MKKNKFLDTKGAILENLDILKINLQECEDLGLQDPEDTTYNEILDLIEEAEAIDTLNDLSEIIIKGRVIETKIDNWYSHEGMDSVNLNWPQI